MAVADREAWLANVRRGCKDTTAKKKARNDCYLLDRGIDPAAITKQERARHLAAIKRDRADARRAMQAGTKRLHAARKFEARPAWADRAAITAFYAEARRLTRETGIPHEVDHIEPLLGRDACGLHVEYNLRVVPRTVNRRKGNRRPLEAAAFHR